MSNPQGPGRYPNDDADATEQTGELPAWGTPPPGGWGAARGGDGLEHTGAWSPDQDPRDGWADGTSDAGWDPATARHDASRDAGTGAWPGEDGGATGGWNAQDPGATGGWDARDTGGWDAQGSTGRRGAPDTTQATPWGDDDGAGDSWAVPTGRHGGRRRAPEEPTEAVPAGAPASAWGDEQATVAQPSDGGAGGAHGGGPDEEQPWAPRDAVRSPTKARTKWLLVGGGVLLVALVLLSALVWPAWALPARLDQTALQAGVNTVLTEDYKLTVGAVQCPDDVTASTGTRFSCQAVVDGEQVEVPAVVTSDDGDYQVQRV